MSLCMMTNNIETLSMKTLSKMTHIIMTISLMSLIRTAKRIMKIILYKDNRHNDLKT